MKFESHSQAGQDRFALEMIGGRGTFVDIGASEPVRLSNTFGLEQMGWSGLLVENDQVLVQRLRWERTGRVLEADATKVDWDRELPGSILEDYLSLDVDEGSPEALERVLSGGPRFRCMTVEHDAYRFGDGWRVAMCEMLTRHGYEVLCSEVMHERMAFELWAVAPELVDMEKAGRFRRLGPVDWMEFWETT